MRVSIRDGVAADAEAICAIHNQGIEDRVATLESELRTPDDRPPVAREQIPASPGHRG